MDYVRVYRTKNVTNVINNIKFAEIEQGYQLIPNSTSYRSVNKWSKRREIFITENETKIVKYSSQNGMNCQNS